MTKHASVKVGNRRLLKLADFLEKLPRKRFDYTTWASDDSFENPQEGCGTSACALGWATTMPEFRRLGLRLDGVFARFPVLGREGTWEAPEDFGAAEILFGLARNGSESIYLFAPDPSEQKATPKYVAKKIRKFVKAREAK